MLERPTGQQLWPSLTLGPPLPSLSPQSIPWPHSLLAILKQAKLAPGNGLCLQSSSLWYPPTRLLPLLPSGLSSDVITGALCDLSITNKNPYLDITYPLTLLYFF